MYSFGLWKAFIPLVSGTLGLYWRKIYVRVRCWRKKERVGYKYEEMEVTCVLYLYGMMGCKENWVSVMDMDMDMDGDGVWGIV